VTGTEGPRLLSLSLEHLLLLPLLPLIFSPILSRHRAARKWSRGHCRLQPPFAVVTGRGRRRRSDLRVRRRCPHLVRYSLAVFVRRNHIAAVLQYRRRRKASPETSPTVSLPQIYSRSSDLNPRVQNRSLIWKGINRSGPSRPHKIQRTKSLILPKGYQPIRYSHVACSDLK
jgi:hypothetical protein